MLISDQHQFIFVHIPKTAGSSLRSALQPYAIATPRSHWSRLLKRFDLPKHYQKFRFVLHATLQDAQRKMPNETFACYQKIAFVRNPWDRMVSSYAFKIHGTPEKQRTRSDSFEDFLYRELAQNKRQQIDYLYDLHGKLNCDFIGRFESLADDYQKLGRLLEIRLPALPKLNTSKRHRNYRDFYTDATRHLVAKHYQDDIEHFQYQF